MVGIKDVAKHAGVSIATVSNVVNRPGIVSAETRSRVLSAIQELGYVRDESARRLRAGDSRLLAVLVLDLANPFFVDIVRGAEQAALAAGLNLITCNSGQSTDTESSTLAMLAEQRVRGVLFCPVDDHSGESLRSLARSGVANVLVDSNPPGHNACSVSANNVMGGKIAIRHLIEMRHRRIAMVNGPANLAPCRDREEGAHAAIAAAPGGRHRLTVLREDELTVASGRAAGMRLLAMDQRPTAVFCANDLLALGVLQAMVAGGVKVPAEMAIVGYDDIEFAAAAAVPLTSVRQPTVQIGRTAARLLIEETSPETAADHRHQSVVFTPELVVRETSRR